MNKVKTRDGLEKPNHRGLYQSLVPVQRIGGQSNIMRSVNSQGSSQANLMFVQLKKMLENVSMWHRTIPGVSARFELTDEFGNVKKGWPSVGDHVRIRIPGPGLIAGNTYDWGSVRSIDNFSTQAVTIFHLLVMPSANPLTGSCEIAHFLTGEASTSFLLIQEGVKISLMIRSRNEQPNTKVAIRKDRIRNRVVGFVAAAGFSHYQWSALAAGLFRSAKRQVRSHI